MPNILPNITYKIVYLSKDVPDILMSKISESKKELLDYASKNKISDYMINELVEEKDGSFTWQITEDGLGKEFKKNYASFQAMRTPNKRLLFYGVGLAGGMITYFLAKKVVPNSYVSALLAIIGSMVSMNLYLKVQSITN